MKQEKKLILQMAIFFLIIFISLGTIVINEKRTSIFLPKIESSITAYLEKKYNNLELVKEKTKYENNTYTMKLKNPKNENHYFTIIYKNKEITDTYEEDYLKGKTLLSHLNKIIENKILKETNINTTITINNTFDNFSDKVKEKLLIEENIESLKIYTLETELTSTWTSNKITKNISDLMIALNNDKITPKNYTITITDETDITKSLKIKNLTYDSIKNNTLEIIISDIINNNETSILTENNITYEYLN